MRGFFVNINLYIYEDNNLTMKKFYLLVSGFIFGFAVNGQIVDIPDANFKAKLLSASPSNVVAQNALTQYIAIDSNANGEIEVSEALAVTKLNVNSSSISDLTGVEAFVNLTNLYCGSNNLTSLDLHILLSLKGLIANNCNINTITLPNPSALTVIQIDNNELTALDISAQINLKELRFSYNNVSVLDLSNNGQLTFLDLSNNQISTIDFTPLTHIKYLFTSSNPLNSIYVNNLVTLETLTCVYNNLSTINLSQLVNLKNLNIGGNPLGSINLSTLLNLEDLNCCGIQITALNLNGLTKLKYLRAWQNQLTSVDLSTNLELQSVNFWQNSLTSLDVSMLTKLNSLSCDSNQLHYLNVKNGKSETLYISDNPDLEYVCADESQFSAVSSQVSEQTVVGSYCSFSPGGSFYTISGHANFDNESNGCDVFDTAVNGIKFLSISGQISGIFISPPDFYHIDVQAGTYQLEPVLENPSYFNISPASVQVNFPTQSSPAINDFCLTPNGTHPDLEISLIPINAARPGFDANYKLKYQNKGTHTQSGTINMSFDDAILDIIDANPDTAGPSPELLVWTFTDLHPFESREINVTINLNSTVETPSINGGDILHYTATITSSQTDETPLDNTFTLSQTVVNSFDPNDKTCLEGNTITPEMIGEYVHYIIRFENTGTANAQNIVVKDMIDTAKFDVSSLIPLDGSHPFTTRITDTNKVEFIFENIQLPFDDANNDGYVAFKIKTKPTLIVGNTFSNTASIYFDYNAPIVTNTATTAIQVLDADDFDFNTRFTLYPNPVNDILNIKSKDNAVIASLSVYNTLGQLVLTVTNPIERINVSELATGNYMVQIVSEKGRTSSRFIKK